MAEKKTMVPENARTKARARALLDFGRQMNEQSPFNLFSGKKKREKDGPQFKRAPGS